jgi:ectoine hydroxylase
MVEPVQDLFGEKLYMHQFKINGKMAFEGDVWQWHQDYGTWKNDDMMPTERAMNVAIFLDDVNEFNGPLMFIPGSHKKGVVDAKHDLTTTSYPLWTVDNDLIRSWSDAPAAERRHRLAQGPGRLDDPVPLLPGARLGQQPEPWNRGSVYLSLCAVSNHIRRFKRPEYIAHRDFTPIECLPDDCLLKDYPVDLPWKDGMPASALVTSSEPFADTKRPHEPAHQTPAARAEGKPVRVGLIGAGKFGSMYLAQIPRTPGVPGGHRRPVARRRARQPGARGLEASAPRRLARRRAQDGAPMSATTGRRWCATAIDVIVECTGHPIAAVDHCLEAFAQASTWST